MKTLVDVLREDALEHIKRGTIKLPVDVEAFADRLVEAQRRSFVLKLLGSPTTSREEYVSAIKQVCTELNLAVKE